MDISSLYPMKSLSTQALVDLHPAFEGNFQREMPYPRADAVLSQELAGLSSWRQASITARMAP